MFRLPLNLHTYSCTSILRVAPLSNTWHLRDEPFFFGEMIDDAESELKRLQRIFIAESA
jgi:hypothetical protein